jgi:squalene-hopene/tetraprenyl-beta-curcumene cyclase
MKNSLPRRWCFVLAGLGIGFTGTSRAGDVPPASADEPKAAQVSLERAAQYLDTVALDWTRERLCGTCHTNYAYMIGRPALRGVGRPDASKEVRDFFEARVAHWNDDEKEAKPRWDAEVIATAVTLAINDATTTRKLHPATRAALDRIWTVQHDDGGFEWLKCGWPPYEHDDYFGAVFAALGAGLAPEGYADSPQAAHGIEKLRRYLHDHQPPDLHHRTFLLWASLKVDGLMTKEEQNETKTRLLSLQKSDGGWALPSLGEWKRRDGSANAKDAPSDGYATGLVVYVLRQAGISVDDLAIRRGVAWLTANQRASGRWFTRSLNNDKAHYIANAGTAYAVMALAACPRAQQRETDSTFKIKPTRQVEQVRLEALQVAPPIENGAFRDNDLVDLAKLDPTIKLDIRYATSNNFLGVPLYTSARAFMQRPAAEALTRAHGKLAEKGHGLLVFDAYRPWHVTKIFWECTPQDQRVFVADPSKGSRHNRGCAVDVSLYDLRTGEPLEMVSGYDEFTERAYPDYPGGTDEQRAHRAELRQALEAEGFTVYEAEWWHFDYRDWQKYPIGNRRFEEL